MTLAKNYTGPTMGVMAPTAIDPPNMDLVIPFRGVDMRFNAVHRLAILGRLAPVALDPPSVDIPPPPMGKLIFSTFPAVYKARIADPTTGRIFPRRTR